MRFLILWIESHLENIVWTYSIHNPIAFRAIPNIANIDLIVSNAMSIAVSIIFQVLLTDNISMPLVSQNVFNQSINGLNNVLV